jgi:hypothetical protein
MLGTLQTLETFTVRAEDDDAGRIDDLYCDDRGYSIRYAVVMTGAWLSGRRVLIAPLLVRKIDWSAHVVQTALTREQIAAAPLVDFDRPVSRQRADEYVSYYGLPSAWGGGAVWGGFATPAFIEARQREQRAHATDPHLRSCRSLRHYAVSAIDKRVGHVHDFVFDDATWTVRQLVVAPGRFAKQLHIALNAVREIDWQHKRITVALTHEEIERGDQPAV